MTAAKRFRPRTTSVERTTESAEDRCRRVFAFITAYMGEHEYAPSLRDIKDGCDIRSLETVHTTVTALEYQGLIQRDPTAHRGMRLTRVKA